MYELYKESYDFQNCSMEVFDAAKTPCN